MRTSISTIQPSTPVVGGLKTVLLPLPYPTPPPQWGGVGRGGVGVGDSSPHQWLHTLGVGPQLLVGASERVAGNRRGKYQQQPSGQSCVQSVEGRGDCPSTYTQRNTRRGA
eukprot:TRINITY_DN14205_c3_g1_i1.p1 TRINITY_DN14205_c3_g1~~TRINITY_DN14205_c3_g1_i1.p1  ORF type:complete len:111 (-),score=7.72 TRINITY_DN14205_c3_g1_i1:190-522(-)